MKKIATDAATRDFITSQAGKKMKPNTVRRQAGKLPSLHYNSARMPLPVHDGRFVTQSLWTGIAIFISGPHGPRRRWSCKAFAKGCTMIPKLFRFTKVLNVVKASQRHWRGPPSCWCMPAQRDGSRSSTSIGYMILECVRNLSWLIIVLVKFRHSTPKCHPVT